MADSRVACRGNDQLAIPAEDSRAHLTTILDIGLGDAADLAGRLIAEFGTFPAVLNGSAARIFRATGNAGVIRRLTSFQAALRYALSAPLIDAPILSDWQALLDYLRADMAHCPIERVRVLHLNTRNMLIRDELISEGTIDRSAIYVREVIRRALELGSASLILVHNHPSGDPSPSRTDVEITKALARAGSHVDIAVHDHLIIGTHGHVSLRAQGLI